MSTERLLEILIKIEHQLDSSQAKSIVLSSTEARILAERARTLLHMQIMIEELNAMQEVKYERTK